MFSWIFMMIPWCFCVFSHLLCVLLACSPLRIPSNSTSNTRVLNAPHAARCTSHWVCVQADVLLAWKQRCTPYKLHVFFRTRCFTILKCSLVTHAKFWVFHKWIEHAQKRKKNINKSSLCLQKDARCCVKVKVYIATFAGIDVSQPSGTLWKPQRENIARQSGVGYVQRIDSPFSDKRDETG